MFAYIHINRHIYINIKYTQTYKLTNLAYDELNKQTKLQATNL